MEKQGYYIVMGVDGEDTLYFQFENREELNKAMEAMIKGSVKAKFKGKEND